MQIRAVVLPVLVLSSFNLWGCASTPERAQTQETTASAGGQHGGQHACPMKLENVQISSENTENGASLTYVTTGDVSELRRRVHAIAQSPDEHGRCCAAMGKDQLPETTLTAEDIPGGARLVFTPKDSEQLETLRQSLQTRAQQMQAGSCPMKQQAPEA